MSKEKTSWSSIKTGFARTKHKVLAQFGAAETTVDSKIIAEKDKLFTLFKLMKRLNKNVDKYEATLKEINIVQNEIAHDLLALNEHDPAIKAYQETQMNLEQERIRIEEILENYYHDPLRIYLSQFRDIRSRLEELDVRRLDMDRYYRDYNIKANKGKDASSLQKTENKHQRTKEAYQELSDEVMKDMYALFDDRKLAFDPAFACFINKNNEYFARSAAEYQKALPAVQHIDEYQACNHPNVITPVELSAMSTNVRASSVFTSPKEYSSSGGSTPQRSRASTIATPSPQPTASAQPYQPPTSYESPPSYGGGGINLNKQPSPPTSYPPPSHQQQPSLYPPTTNEVPYYSPPEQQHSYQPPQTYPNLNKTTSPTPTHPPTNLNKTVSPNMNSGRPLPSPTPNTTTSPFNNNKPRASTMMGQAPSGRPLPTPVPAAPIKKAEALYDFDAQDSTELSFRKGDILTLYKENGEWVNAELHGVKGLVPENHIRRL